MKIHKTFCREELEKLPSDQLDRMLHEELDNENKNSDLILELMHILEERETDTPKPDIGKAWEMFVERYNTEIEPEPVRQKKKSCRWLGTVAAAVAIFLVVSFGIPKVAGYDNIIELVASWTDDFFTLSSPDNVPVQNEYVFKTDNPGLQQVYDAVTELGITDPVVPMWLPDGYELVELKTDSLNGSVKIYARFVNNKNEATLSYKIYHDHQLSKLFKDDTAVNQHESNGVIYSVLTNEHNATASWNINNVVCVLSISAEKDVLLKIIDYIT